MFHLALKIQSSVADVLVYKIIVHVCGLMENYKSPLCKWNQGLCWLACILSRKYLYALS